MTRIERALRGGLARLRAAPWRTFAIRRLPSPTPLVLIGAGFSLRCFVDRAGLGGLVAENWPTVPAWSLRHTVEACMARGEMVLARLPGRQAAKLAPLGLLAPELVDSVIDLERLAWPPSRSARSNLRRIAENGLTWRLQTDAAAFDRFYERCYLPYMQARHGMEAARRKRVSLRWQFDRGGIQDVLMGGEIVASQLVAIGADRVHCVAVGVPGDGALARTSGALAATTAFAVDLARQRRLRYVDLGGSLPSRRDPVLLSKCHWGARIAERPQADHDVLIAWPHWSAEVAGLIRELAPIVRGQGGLVGLGTDDLPCPAGLLACAAIGTVTLPAVDSASVAGSLRQLVPLGSEKLPPADPGPAAGQQRLRPGSGPPA